MSPKKEHYLYIHLGSAYLLIPGDNQYGGKLIMMVKNTYRLLYMACFAVVFFINTLSLINPDFLTIVAVAFLSLIEAFIPYLIIILVTHKINPEGEIP